MALSVKFAFGEAILDIVAEINLPLIEMSTNVIDDPEGLGSLSRALRGLDLRAHSPIYPQLTDGPDVDKSVIK